MPLPFGYLYIQTESYVPKFENLPTCGSTTASIPIPKHAQACESAAWFTGRVCERSPSPVALDQEWNEWTAGLRRPLCRAMRRTKLS